MERTERARARACGREREREKGEGEKGLVVCRGLTIPLRRPSLGWMGVGRGGGRRNYAKNVQLVNRVRGGGARVLGDGDGGPGKGASTGVLVWCAMTVNPLLSVPLCLSLSAGAGYIRVRVVVRGKTVETMILGR